MTLDLGPVALFFRGKMTASGTTIAMMTTIATRMLTRQIHGRLYLIVGPGRSGSSISKA